MILRSVIFTGAVQGLFQILLLRSKNRNTQADYWLMLWLFVVSVQLFFYFDDLAPLPYSDGILGVLAFSIPLLSAPILFHYIYNLSTGKNVDFKRLMIYLAPWLTFILVTVSIKISQPLDIFIQFGYPHFSNKISPVMPYIFTLPMAIVPGIYAIMGLIVLHHYQKSLPDRYSYTETINLNWLQWLVFSIIILFIVLFIFIRFGTQGRFIAGNTVFGYVGAVLSVYVFLVGYLGMRQSTLLMTPAINRVTENVEPDGPYKKTGLDETAVEQIYVRLLKHMVIQKPFLSDDLSLALLAEQLSISSNQLSQVINQKSGSNFFVFVNAYRVEEVKIKLLDPSLSHLSILGIAYECGFRSKSAFNRIFKEQTGISPAAYQRQHKA